MHPSPSDLLPAGLHLPPDLAAAFIQLWLVHLLLGFLLERPADDDRSEGTFTLWLGLVLFLPLAGFWLPARGWLGWAALAGLALWRLVAHLAETRARRIAPGSGLALLLLYEAGFVILSLWLLIKFELPGLGCSDRTPLLAWGVAWMLLFPVGDRLVRVLLASVRHDATGDELPTSAEKTRSARVGRLIGWMERLLIFGFALGQQYGAIGFVLAAKSMARFRALDDRDFAEKYLLGTLLSTLVALGTALLVGGWLRGQ